MTPDRPAVMRSLLLTFDYPPTVGGIAAVLARFWRLAGHPGCRILAPAAPGAAAVDDEHPVSTTRFPAPASKAIAMLLGGLWFAASVLRHRPHRVIAGQLVRAGPLAWLYHCVTGRPYDLWVYGGETRLDFTASASVSRFLHTVLRSAATVYTIGPYTTSEMLAFGLDPAAVVELPLGVDTGRYAPAPRDAELEAGLGLRDRLVFLTVGRLVERKGVDRMLEALARVDADLPPWHYLIVSDGPYRSALEALTLRLGLQDRVTFTGFVDADQLPAYYNLCDVFAMPNREVVDPQEGSLSVEGFGLVFLEAAACAKPVIAGRSGGAVDAVDEGVNGYLVDDEASLDTALRELADPERRARMGGAGVDFAARFDWERSAQILRRRL